MFSQVDMTANHGYCASRRAALLAAIPDNSVVVVSAAPEIIRSRDTDFPFRQDSDFYYLTHFPEPEAVLLLQKDAKGECSEQLFCRDKDELAEVWHGRRYGFTQATALFGIEAKSLSLLDESLLLACNQKTHVYFAQGLYKALDEKLFALLATLRAQPKKGYVAPTHLIDLRPVIAEQRLIKDAFEIQIMQAAGKISATAHTRAMQRCANLQFEYQLEAEIRHEFAMQGARHCAYNTIVGAGENGCILHYTDNDAALKDGDLVLIDAGCELQGYAADITRTFPINGKFSQEQAAIYQLVLDAQLAACAKVKPGNTSKDTLDATIAVLTLGLMDLGILQGDFASLVAELACKKYFIHGLGHWLGLDVHDVGAYKIAGAERPFCEGMVLTIEPGLYIPKGSACDEKWWGIAVRIEDDLLVIKDGHLNLTDTAPKTISAIEAIMAKS
jgi:Xaa-Pro aminopeptidase